MLRDDEQSLVAAEAALATGLPVSAGFTCKVDRDGVPRLNGRLSQTPLADTVAAMKALWPLCLRRAKRGTARLRSTPTAAALVARTGSSTKSSRPDVCRQGGVLGQSWGEGERRLLRHRTGSYRMRG